MEKAEERGVVCASAMGEVNTNGSEPQQQNEDECCGSKSRKLLTCFRILFDAAPFDDCDGASHGVSAFQAPFQVVVPLIEPLEEATLGMLMTTFLSHVSCRFPELSEQSLEAFFVIPDVDGDGGGGEDLMTTDCRQFMRLDACVNRSDTLDKFFAPVFNSGMNVYNVIAQWSSKKPETDAGLNRMSKKDQTENQGDDENGENMPLDRIVIVTKSISRANLELKGVPEPVLYPFTQRCTFAKLLPRIPAHYNNDCPLQNDEDPQAADMVASMAAKHEAQNARRALEAEEQSARRLLMAEERVARNEVADWENEERRQTVAYLRLIDKNVPLCGVDVDFFPKPMQRYPVETEPLATFPSEDYMKELLAVAEETAWISHLFSKMPIAGAPFFAVKQKKEEMTTSAEENRDAESCAKKGFCKAVDDLLLRYMDFRRDLLTLERKDFAALTKEMDFFLKRQRELEGEIIRTAFHEELKEASVFDFNSYEHHYCWRHYSKPVEEGSDATGMPSKAIVEKPIESKDVTSFFIARPAATSQLAVAPESSEKMTKNEEEEIAVTAAAAATATATATVEGDPATVEVPSFPAQQPLTSLTPECDEYFGKILQESRARAKAALETIALIEMRWHEPVAFKLAKHRIDFEEKEMRKVICTEEEENWERLCQCAEQERLDWERYELFAYKCLIDPVVNLESQVREKLCEQHERQSALLFSLFHRGVEQLMSL